MRAARSRRARCRRQWCWKHRGIGRRCGDSERSSSRVPTVLIASRTETVPLPPVAAVFYRPVRVGEIVPKVLELLGRGAHRLARRDGLRLRS